MPHGTKTPGRSSKRARQQERAERILDSTAELILRWGYGKVTIDDIARQAGIGKGTIYLHWKTREDLFEALLLRESALMMKQLIQFIQQEQDGILLHRLIQFFFKLTERHPLIKALFTGDREMLGHLASANSPDNFLRFQRLLFAREYISILRARGLLLRDMQIADQIYAILATISGFFLVNLSLRDADLPDIGEKSQTLAQTIHNAFGPHHTPSATALQEALQSALPSFEQLYAELQSRLEQKGGTESAQL
ncbi:TetR/AcrR family transcriptional regulator [Ktedonosporobacter rubrisoli]|uniref:TetR/AcrR family transcriptional regulator n=1 Tax=Ktedonosporobacter rubrisoli TaxID=2509675 RepID=A0A4P6JI53_KTERU|nr:TetR/AcrR family transcriptional regulator [Ktedonosporobacter rubrisoli]QBD74727.1 TetR/AcrR family transcriptional regulator [Ktedonosporobacter rubrisoli]